MVMKLVGQMGGTRDWHSGDGMSVTPQRSAIMSAIRSKDTRPELRVRRALHRLGFRYRLHVPSLPGKPDVVLPGRGTIFLINGCFWHQHSCSAGRIPSSNQDYWIAKLAVNTKRDRRNLHKLRALGWSVHHIWECRLKQMSEDKLEAFLLGRL